jgi:hypothetical protein
MQDWYDEMMKWWNDEMMKWWCEKIIWNTKDVNVLHVWLSLKSPRFDSWSLIAFSNSSFKWIDVHRLLQLHSFVSLIIPFILSTIQSFLLAYSLGTFINSPVFRDTPSDTSKTPHIQKCPPISRKPERFTDHPTIHNQLRQTETTSCSHKCRGPFINVTAVQIQLTSSW